MESQISQSQSNPEKNKIGGITFSDFHLYYEPIVIKMVWYWHKNKTTDKWNRIASPEINPSIYSQITFDRAIQNSQWRKESL